MSDEDAFNILSEMQEFEKAADKVIIILKTSLVRYGEQN